MHRVIRRCLSAGFVVCWTAAASAHDTWLLPARFEVAKGAAIELELTSGMKFPEPESPVAPDRIATSGVRAGGKTAALRPLTPTKGALRLSAVPATGAGVAVLWVVSRPRALSLTPDQVKHYLEEVDAPPTVEARYRQQGQFRETYSKVAKTYVKVGEAASDPSWQEPAGLSLEFVPLSNPTALRAGTKLSVRLLRDGKPMPNLGVSAVAPGGGQPVKARTDAQGRVDFQMDRPGPWLLRATLIEESSAADTEWHSTFTTLSLSVAP